MANYILIHGGDSKGSVWNDVADLLRQSGNRVYHPSLTSIKQATLEQNIGEICDLIHTESLDNIILVGHSYGAMVITGVHDCLSDKIKYLTYVDSAIPKNGYSLYGMFAELGFNYEDFDLTPDQPCVASLFFDEKKLNQKQKAYIHCLQSEFISITKPIYEEMKSNTKAHHWIVFDLDTVHACMISQPKELAVILSGLQIFCVN